MTDSLMGFQGVWRKPTRSRIAIDQNAVPTDWTSDNHLMSFRHLVQNEALGSAEQWLRTESKAPSTKMEGQWNSDMLPKP